MAPLVIEIVAYDMIKWLKPNNHCFPFKYYFYLKPITKGVP